MAKNCVDCAGKENKIISKACTDVLEKRGEIAGTDIYGKVDKEDLLKVEKVPHFSNKEEKNVSMGDPRKKN